MGIQGEYLQRFLFISIISIFFIIIINNNLKLGEFLVIPFFALDVKLVL